MRTFTAIALAILCGAAARADLPPTNTQALRLSAPVNDLVWDATRGRFFASSGTSVLMVNPDTAAIEDSWTTNGTGGQLAVSGDGQYLYVAIGARGVVDRYRVRDHGLDAEISLGLYTTGTARQPSSMAVVPGQPQVLL